MSMIQQNTISITHPDLVKHFVNKEDAILYSAGSSRNVMTVCVECGYKKPMQIGHLTKRGFTCPLCSDHMPYPEKFLFSMLEQLTIDFKTQLTKTTFEWCNNYKYDFYIDSINCIIETHGIQHYEKNTNWKMSLDEILDNDRLKNQFAKENSITNYIVLDCRYSNMECIKNSIIGSNLPKLLGFNINDIDWSKCHEFSLSSLVKLVSTYWENGINNVMDIANKLKVSRNTARFYLKQGAEMGWCSYNIEEENKKKYDAHIKLMIKKVICLSTGEIFNSLVEAGRFCNMKETSNNSISLCCRHKINTAGKHPETGEKMVWMYYDEYLIKNETIGWLENYIEDCNHNNKKYVKVICLTTNEVFNSQTEASLKYNISKNGISSCCRKISSSAGKHPVTGSKLVWMFYNEYLLDNIC